MCSHIWEATYIEFDLQKMVEEDHYNEFVIMFRLLHASRFIKHGDDSIIFERYFNQSVESGNRIRDGLSRAAQLVMETIGSAAIKHNESLRSAIDSGRLTPQQLHKELIHFIYKLLFTVIHVNQQKSLVRVSFPVFFYQSFFCNAHVRSLH